MLLGEVQNVNENIDNMGRSLSAGALLNQPQIFEVMFTVVNGADMAGRYRDI